MTDIWKLKALKWNYKSNKASQITENLKGSKACSSRQQIKYQSPVLLCYFCFKGDTNSTYKGPGMQKVPFFMSWRDHVYHMIYSTVETGYSMAGFHQVSTMVKSYSVHEGETHGVWREAQVLYISCICHCNMIYRDCTVYFENVLLWNFVITEHRGPLLLTSFNFNPNIDKGLLSRLHRSSLGIYK